MYELTQSWLEQDFQPPILNLFEICLDIREHFTAQEFGSYVTLPKIMTIALLSAHLVSQI
jgi:hypothetical protein